MLWPLSARRLFVHQSAAGSLARYQPNEYNWNTYMATALKPVDFHILLALAAEPRHGYGLMKEVARESGGTVRLEIGSLYRLLARLLDEGLIEEAEEDERRRYYRLTRQGRSVLKAEARRLAQVVELSRARNVLPAERA
jgi:DNA-binding PadR family transcriptional regulator